MHAHGTEVRFASFLSGGFTTMIVINPPEKKLAKRTSGQWGAWGDAFFQGAFVFNRYCFQLLHVNIL